MGMRAELDGTRLLVGNPALLGHKGVALTDEAQGWTERLRRGGETFICLAHDEDLIGLLGVSAPYAPRPGPSSSSCEISASPAWCCSPATHPRPHR